MLDFKFSIMNQGANKEPIGITHKGKFNPLTVLGDLISCANSEERLICCFEDLFGVRDEESGHLIMFRECIQELNHLLHTESRLTFENFEILRIYNNLRFSVEVVIYKNGCATKVLQTGFCLLDDVFLQIENSNLTFIYTCQSMKDVVYAIMHYLLLQGYKFRQCNHCEKLFATKTYKEKYCPRNSPITGYTHLQCGIAVDHILKKIRKRKKYTLDYLSCNYPNAVIEFINAYDRIAYVDGDKTGNSWIQLNLLLELCSKEFRKRWYSEAFKSKAPRVD